MIGAKQRLKDHGYIDWIRRSVRTGLPKQFGLPQRMMIPNLVYFTADRLVGLAAEVFNKTLAALRLKRARQTKPGAESDRSPKAASGTVKPVMRRRETNLNKLNPVGMANAREQLKRAVAAGEEAERRVLAEVEANRDFLLAQMRELTG